MRRALLLLIVSAGAVLGTGPQQARALDPATATVAVEGTADTAAGTWQGTLTGTFGGRHTTADGTEIPWTVLVSTPVKASFAGTSPACGVTVASGEVAFEALEGGQAFGVWPNKLLVPRSIVRAAGRFDVAWHQAGTSGTLVVSGLTLEVEVYGLGWVTVVDAADVGGGTGTTTFVPDAAEACAGTGSLDAQLAGLTVGS